MCEGGGLVVFNPILSCKEEMSMLITLEPQAPQGIFWIKLLPSADTWFSHLYANGDEVWPSIFLASRCILVKMLISLEPHRIF